MLSTRDLRFSQVIVGSCPKCAADVHRIADESPATAILCLQARTAIPSSMTHS